MGATNTPWLRRATTQRAFFCPSERRRHYEKTDARQFDSKPLCKCLHPHGHRLHHRSAFSRTGKLERNLPHFIGSFRSGGRLQHQMVPLHNWMHSRRPVSMFTSMFLCSLDIRFCSAKSRSVTKNRSPVALCVIRYSFFHTKFPPYEVQ